MDYYQQSLAAFLARPVARWAAIQDVAANVNVKHQRRQSNRYMLPMSALAHLATHTQQFSMHCSMYGEVSHHMGANHQMASSSESSD